jgi:archaellum component FlaG (FlaF/FlaG flagellin family)
MNETCSNSTFNIKNIPRDILQFQNASIEVLVFDRGN